MAWTFVSNMPLSRMAAMRDEWQAEREFRVRVVSTIVSGRPETALHLLSKRYGVDEPALRVGTVKRHRRVLACYVEREKRIYLSKSDFITDPFIILHEFYHHLRASGVRRGQVEKRADEFALGYIRAFNLAGMSAGRR
jgi:hypothetical protein